MRRPIADQPVERGEQDCRDVIRQRDRQVSLEGERRERPRCLQQRPRRIHHLARRCTQLLAHPGAHQPPPLLDQQRVAEVLAQPPKRVAGRCRRDPQSRGRTSDVRLLEQEVQCLGAIEVEARYVHDVKHTGFKQ